MTDDELEKMGFVKQIQVMQHVLPGETIDLHSEYFINKDRLRAGVWCAKHLKEWLDHEYTQPLTDAEDDPVRIAYKQIAIFLGVVDE